MGILPLPSPLSKLMGKQVYAQDARYIGEVVDFSLKIGEALPFLIVRTPSGRTLDIPWSDVAAAEDFVLLKPEFKVPKELLTPAIARAVISGDVKSVKKLLKEGADPNVRDEKRQTPLHHAVKDGRLDIVKLLVKSGADVNARDDDDWTPLHYAAGGGYADVVRLLLEHGADVNARDKDGRTPLDVAREKGHEKVARVIEEYERGVGVGAVAPREPAPAAPSILGVECPGLRAGEWGRLLVRVQGSGTATLSLEGDVDWLDPGRVKLSGDAVVEVPVRPRAAGEVPVRVVLKSPSGEDTKITWLKVVDRAGRCPSCGAPAEPGAKYCWRCGARLTP